MINKQHGFLEIHSFELNSKRRFHEFPLVGQPADSYLITVHETDHIFHILIDGGKLGHGKEIILPYLRSQQINHLDYVILTHQHFDHFSGLMDLITATNELSIGKFIYSPVKDNYLNSKTDPFNFEHWVNFHHQLLYGPSNVQQVIVWNDTHVGSIISLTEELKLTLIAAPDERLYIDRDQVNINDLSLVFRLDYRKFSALFTGDCGKEQAELILQSEYSPYIEQVTLLKASHHGGDGSTTAEFISRNNSKIVLIPCNDTVVFERPSFIENLYQLSKNNAKILREDDAVYIHLQTDGHILYCQKVSEKYEDSTVIIV